MNRFSKIFWIIFFGVLLGVGQTVSAGFLYIILISFILGYLLWKYSKKEDKRFILLLYTSGLVLRITLSVIFYFHSFAQGYNGFLSGDAGVYSERGWQIAQYWLDPLKNSFPNLKYGINGYTYFIAFFYSLFGYSPLAIKFINSLLGTASGIIIYYLSKDLFKIKIARLSGLLVVFSPSLIRWSIDSLKDPAVIFLLILFFWILMKFQKKKWAYLILLCCILLILKTLGNPLYVICAFILGIVFFVILRIKLLLKAGLIFLLLLIFQFSYPKSLNIKDQAQELFKKAAYYQRIQAVSDKAGYFIYDDATLQGEGANLFSLFQSYIKGLSYAIFSPFPWAISSELQLFAYPQILIWYFLFPFTIVGILSSLRYKIQETLPIILYIFLTTSLLALAEGNIGGVFRHRDWVSPFFLIFAASGLVWIFGGRKGELWS